MNKAQSNVSRIGERKILFELPIDLDTSVEEIVAKVAEGRFLLTYLNPYSYAIDADSKEYGENLNRFDCVVCDGVGIQIAAKTVFGKKPRILTPDYDGIGRDCLKIASELGMSVCLVGSHPETSKNAVRRLNQDFPKLKKIEAFGGYDDGPLKAKEYILMNKTDLVIAGMGMGKQESFLLELAGLGWSGTGFCVGGFIDKLADPRLEYQSWATKLNIRFAGRLIREPKRLSRRYFIDYQKFVGLYLHYLFARRRS